MDFAVGVNSVQCRAGDGYPQASGPEAGEEQRISDSFGREFSIGIFQGDRFSMQ
jgi:hypothetical protein